MSHEGSWGSVWACTVVLDCVGTERCSYIFMPCLGTLAAFGRRGLWLELVLVLFDMMVGAFPILVCSTGLECPLPMNVNGLQFIELQ